MSLVRTGASTGGARQQLGSIGKPAPRRHVDHRRPWRRGRALAIVEKHRHSCAAVSLPLEDYAMIGDGETAALVSRDGSVDWLCWPRFDSDACFAALLGNVEHGRWLIGPVDPVKSRARRYQTDTLIMETDLVTETGSVRLIDFMPIREDVTAMIRIVAGLDGTCRLRMDLRLRFDYGTVSPWTEPADHGFVATVGPDQVELHAPVPLEIRDHAAAAEFSVSAGQRLAFVLRHHNFSQPAPQPPDAEAALGRTQQFWREWIGRFDDRKTRWPREIRRSLITLKAMIHRPTGGLVAAPTTSLPEAPGGTMNWDYRYCWLRDSTFALGALINAGYHDEARCWRDWLVRTIGGSPANMRIMYRVDGGRHLNEWSVSGLPGYRYAQPVRIGNAASAQRQIDVLGRGPGHAASGGRSGIAAFATGGRHTAGADRTSLGHLARAGIGPVGISRRTAALHVFPRDGLGRDRSLPSLAPDERGSRFCSPTYNVA